MNKCSYLGSACLRRISSLLKVGGSCQLIRPAQSALARAERKLMGKCGKTM